MNNILSEKDTKAVLEILVEQLGVPENQLTPDASLEQDLSADSLTQTEIVLALEDHFGLSVPDDQVEKISTVGDLFEAIAEQLTNRRQV